MAAQPASAGAIVEHTNPAENPGACFFEPGDVPGVDAFYEATCTFVHLPSGDLQVVARSQLPEGYTLEKTYVGELKSCFGGTGRVVATTSGQVRATCRIPGSQAGTPTVDSVSPTASRVIDLGGGLYQFEWDSELPPELQELQVVFAIEDACPDGFTLAAAGLVTAESPENQARFVGEFTNDGEGFNYLEGFSGLPVAEPRGIVYAVQCQAPAA
jgi:hypothetical protein